MEKNRLYFANKGSGNYDIIVVAFCVLLLISNICATKLIEFGPFITDGGAFLFPLTYIIGDLLAEVYGLKATRRAIKLGFIFSIIASITFYLVQISPPASAYENQAAFEAVLGFVPRIVAASLAGYLVGQFLNALVMVKLKEKAKENKLWVRLVGSTMVGEFADTLVFCTIAFFGTITGWEFVNYVITGYAYKCLIEVLMLPVTYRVIGWVKSKEPSYFSNPVPENNKISLATN
ncbi:MAG: queuosine precursor transporter [Micrococcaceae bacterium]